MGLTQAFFLKPAHPVHRWVETQNEIHFFFLRPGNEYDYGPGAWEMQRSNKNTSLADYREQKNWQKSR